MKCQIFNFVPKTQRFSFKSTNVLKIFDDVIKCRPVHRRHYAQQKHHVPTKYNEHNLLHFDSVTS